MVSVFASSQFGLDSREEERLCKSQKRDKDSSRKRSVQTNLRKRGLVKGDHLVGAASILEDVNHEQREQHVERHLKQVDDDEVCKLPLGNDDPFVLLVGNGAVATDGHEQRK